MLAAGDQAPEFELQTTGGESTTLIHLLSNGPVLLAFFKVNCPTCQFTFPFLERMFKEQSRFQIVGISQNDARATGGFNGQYRLTFPMLLDDRKAKYPASNAYKLTHVPSIFLVEPGHRISWTAQGFDKNALEELGHRMQFNPFRTDEKLPDFRPG